MIGRRRRRASRAAPSDLPPDLLGIRYRDGAGRRHVESWFSKANAPDGTRALWVRCTIFARPGLPTVAEAWAIAFDRRRGHLAVKSTVGFETARFAPDTLDAEVDGCKLSLEGTAGALASGRGSIRWDLRLGSTDGPPFELLPLRGMYGDRLPFAKLVTPVPDARVDGQIEVARGGQIDVWDVAGWPAMIGHNWGRGSPDLYAWTHCNAFDVEGLVFEAISARVRVGPLLSPMATSARVRWRDRVWDLSSVGALVNNRGSISLRRWEMTGHGDGASIACEVAAETDDLVGLHYPNPAGTMTYCLNTKLARARLELTLPGKEKLTATSRAAALEIGTLRSDHGVRMYL